MIKKLFFSLSILIANFSWAQECFDDHLSVSCDPSRVVGEADDFKIKIQSFEYCKDINNVVSFRANCVYGDIPENASVNIGVFPGGWGGGYDEFFENCYADHNAPFYFSPISEGIEQEFYLWGEYQTQSNYGMFIRFMASHYNESWDWSSSSVKFQKEYSTLDTIVLKQPDTICRSSQKFEIDGDLYALDSAYSRGVTYYSYHTSNVPSYSNYINLKYLPYVRLTSEIKEILFNEINGYYVINDTIFTKTLSSLKLKNNDKIQIIHVRKNSNVFESFDLETSNLGFLYDDSETCLSYLYKKQEVSHVTLEFNQIKDTVWSNPIYYRVKESQRTPTNPLLVNSDTNYICPTDQFTFNLDTAQYGVFSPIKSYFRDFDVKAGKVQVIQPGWLQYRKYKGTDCPTVSDTIWFLPATGCDSGLVKGSVWANYGYHQDVLVKASNGMETFTDENGNFQFHFVRADSITSVWIANPNYRFRKDTVIYTDSFLYAEVNLNTNYINKNDLEITMSSNRSRPGFTIPQRVIINNRGWQMYNSQVKLKLSPEFSIVSSEDPYQIINDTIVFDQTFNLAPEQNYVIRFKAKLDSTTTLGTILENYAALTNSDDELRNNEFVYQPEVVGSYDPNDKLVQYTSLDDDRYVRDSTKFNYTIRFQNTGTDTAFTVRVEDPIDSDLDISTLSMIGASHDYSMSIKNDTLAWLFEDILLADSTTDEPNSHGWINFTIEQKPNNPLGTEINNHALIFFDYNLPIITNETESILGEKAIVEVLQIVDCNGDLNGEATIDDCEVCSGGTTGIAPNNCLISSTANKSNIDFIVHPNPTSGTVNFNRIISIIQLYSINGTLIKTTSNADKLNLDTLDNGLYFLKVKDNNLNEVVKIIKK